MENNFLSILALIWVVYIFLFTEADRQLSELLNRLKASLAVDDKGTFQLNQFWASQSFGVAEIIEWGKLINDKDSRKKNINKFYKKYQKIKWGKLFLIINLFLLSSNIIISALLGFLDTPIIIFKTYIVGTHIVLSLIFGFVFYIYVSKSSNLKFIGFTRSH